MPAEVCIWTQDRTPLEYLLKPLHEQIGRAVRCALPSAIERDTTSTGE
jgi:hypothetical protein